MTAFHWTFFAFLLIVLVVLVVARRSDTHGDEDKVFQCSVCGDPYSENELIERQFTSGYSHAICGACATALYDEAVSRDLISSNAQKDTGA